ncbi:GMC family oxidoreductase [Mesorhizobium sp. 1B3]|uniref:GMC family oxidoreductase n=1 Tax=Mesorhizobium sp. 1B3 TaxID=3243599 RepID=UPI003D95D3BF
MRLLDDNNDAPLPNVRVNYRFAERDAESVVRSHEVLDRWLRDHNLGLLEYLCPPQERLEHVLEQAVDGYHQIGLTRMCANLRQGVVDANCRVHDTDNLFVAGSSVFPTAGQANPTLSAVALAMRLADHISRRLAQR